MLLTTALGGCADPHLRAPVEDRVVGSGAQRSTSTSTSTSASASASAFTPAPAPIESATTVPLLPPASVATPLPVESAAPRVLPGAENAGKPGYYTVKPGETLIRVGLETGQNWKDIAKWNNIDNSNLIESGQVLRVAPPGAVIASTVKADTRSPTVDGTSGVKPAAPVAMPAPPLPLPPAAVPAETVALASPSPSSTAAPSREDENVHWMWPSGGVVASTFDEGKNKGVTINGKLGDPVLASADGRVVYAGSGLRGYGNLVILKHNNTYLTAYAHNQALFVKEDQTVKRGQKIAEMGSTDADRVQLHFEIRKQGRPVDPLKLLPAR